MFKILYTVSTQYTSYYHNSLFALKYFLGPNDQEVNKTKRILESMKFT